MRCQSISRLFVFAAGAALSVSAASAQTTYPEMEPNNTKADATTVTTLLVVGATPDRLTGTCSTTDPDYWHIKVGPLASGIYRNVLSVAAPTSGTFTHTIRGLSQASGVINTTSDVAAMTASVPTTAGRSVSWYGFGKEEELYYAISHSAPAATTYTVSYARAGAAINDVTAQALYSGPVTIRLRNVSGNLNTDCWLYDSNLNPLAADVPPGSGPAGADGNLIASPPAGTLSSFTRTLTAGTYYLAVAGSNLANNQAASLADTVGFNSNVLELPNAVLCSVATGAAATFFVDLQDTASHTVTTTNFVLGASWGGNVNWVKFTISEPALPSAVFSASPNPVSPGGATTLTATVTPATGGASADITGVTADISALTSTPPTTINLSSSDGGVTWTGLAPVDMVATEGNKTVPFSVTEGGAVPGVFNSSGTVTVGPTNDSCAGAITVDVGMPSSPVSNQYAGNDDGPAACVALVGKGIWYKVTPATTASYQIDTCGSAFNTILSVYQIADCADTGSWTLVGCNDDRPTGVCVESMASAIQDIGLTGGSTYYLRVQSLNNSGTFTTGNTVVTITQTGTAGACCNHASGVCSLTGAAGCASPSSTYQGDGTLCSPSPCMAIGSCCNNTTGVCAIIFGGACPTGTTAGIGATCEPTTCPATGSCCHLTTGACTLIYGGFCPGSTFAGAGAVCDASSCPVIGTCCSNTTGACSLLYAGNCPATSTPGAGLVCEPSTCLPTGTCCTNSTGLCQLIYGGSCAFGRTPGNGTVCDASACPVLTSCCNVNGVCTLIYGGSCPGGTSPGIGTVCDASTCPAIGVCCNNTTGECSVLFGGVCQSGRTLGNGTACEPASCPVFTTCCNNSTGACTVIYGGACPAGSSSGIGTVCDATACPALATCCDTQTGICHVVYGGGCPSGSAIGFGTACNAAACPPLGSCCHNTTGECSLNYSTCPSNTTSNTSLTCAPTPCLPAQSWACCLPDASCALMTQDDCGTHAGSWSAGSTCGSFICSPTNLVLNPGAETSDLTGWTTTGTWSATFDALVHSGRRSFATSSSLRTRTQTIDLVSHGYSAELLDTLPTIIVGDWVASRNDQGARYFVQFDLLDASQAVLATFSHGSAAALITIPANTPYFQESHTFTGYPAGVRFIRITEGGQDMNNWAGFYGAHFDDAFAGVVVLRACCLPDTTCVVQDLATCLAAGGTGQTATSCEPLPCVPATGACCCGSSCIITSPTACSGVNRSFSGAGTVCTPFSLTSPCCRGNFNKSVAGPGAPGGISVQDIFDFLTGYFSSDPCANTNDSLPGPGAPNGISVQDIFDFLSAYFGGC